MDDAKSKTVLVTLQWLRFLAAGLVLLCHISERVLEFQERYSLPKQAIAFSGDLGVIIFFVISGFIMVHVAGSKFATEHAPRNFILGRIFRIVPLYWILTIVQAGYLVWAASRNSEEAGRLTISGLLQSLLFVPYTNHLGFWRPVLEQGWTLNFEMVFYGIFALSLFFRRNIGLAFVLIALFFLAALHATHPDGALGFLADPIVLYFAAGILLAVIRNAVLARGIPLPSVRYPIAICTAIVAIMTALANVYSVSWLEPVVAIILVACAVLCVDSRASKSFSSLAIFAGDISYSLYLSHGFALLAVGIIWRKLFGGEHLIVYFGVTTTVAIAGSVLCYLLLEKPISSIFKAIEPGRKRVK